MLASLGTTAAFAENGPFPEHFEEWYPAFLMFTVLDKNGEPVVEETDGYENNIT